MVEGKVNPKHKLLTSHAIQNVLECFDIPELLELREVNKKIGNEVIPKCFKILKYYCPDDDEEDNKSFFSIITLAKKVEIENIGGTEFHLGKIRQIADNVGKSCRNLHLSFNGDMDDAGIAAQYVDELRKFDSIDQLRLHTDSDGNLTKIIEAMCADANFPWFEKVSVIKCYNIRDMKRKEVLFDFFRCFRNLQEIRGITEEQFDPLEAFDDAHRVPRLSWTIPEVANLRDKVLQFLARNRQDYLRLHGGSIDKIEINGLTTAGLKHLVLQDMPSMVFIGFWDQLPDLTTFYVDNIEDFTVENATVVISKLGAYRGLEKLGMALTVFDLEQFKDAIVNVVKMHHASLRHICFAKNKLTNAFMDAVCEAIAADNVMEEFDLLHLKEVKNIDWCQMLGSIAKLTAGRENRTIRVKISSY